MPNEKLKFEGENLMSAIFNLLIEMRGTQLAAFEVFAGKLTPTEAEAMDMVNEIHRTGYAKTKEVSLELFERFGTIDFKDILPDRKSDATNPMNA